MRLYKKTRVLCLKIFSFFILLFFVLSPVLNAESFDDYNTQPLTSNAIVLHESPSVAVYKKNVHVVWNSWPDEFNCSVYYKRSLDNGRSWDDSILLSIDYNKAIYPKIALNGEIIHVVWKDYRDENPEIYYAKSLDNGGDWSEPKRLTFNCSRKNNIYDINIAVEDSNVYLVWKDYETGSSEIFFKKSKDNGETWTDAKRLTFDYNPSYYPYLAVHKGKLLIVYEDRGLNYNLGFLKSNDNGIDWIEKRLITNSASASEKPYLTIFDNILYLVWQEEIFENRELFFQKSSDFGETWSEIKQLTFDKTSSINPEIVVSEEITILFWQKLVNNSFYIFYKTSNDFGETWSEGKQLVENENCYSVNLASEGQNIHIVWQDFHEGAWGDIWHMGNYNCSVISDKIIDDKIIDNAPGFEFIFLIISVFTLISLIRLKNFNNKKR